MSSNRMLQRGLRPAKFLQPCTRILDTHFSDWLVVSAGVVDAPQRNTFCQSAKRCTLDVPRHDVGVPHVPAA